MSGSVGKSDAKADRTGEFRAALDKLVAKSVSRFREAAGGLAPRNCPICHYHGHFAPFGMPPRLDARCPSCASLERHRMIALLLERNDFLNDSHRLLHFAPEKPLSRVLIARAGTYETADLRPSMRTDHVVNIEAIDLPDGSFDRIVCNHVLEHVDDIRALSELFRILSPRGIAFLTTPVIEGWAKTHEDSTVVDPKARLLNFGQGDHVRLYGRDIRDRIRAAGFELDEWVATEPDVRLYGLWRGEKVFIARKPAGAAGTTVPRSSAPKGKAASRAKPERGEDG